MGIYDLLMLAVMVGSILFGMWKGLAWQVASLAAIFVSYIVALLFRVPLSGYISASEPWNKFAAMLILFLGTSLLIWMSYGYIKKTIKRLRLRGFDRQAGAILGGVKGVLLCMLLTLFSVTLFGERVRQGVINSRSGGYIAAAINKTNTFAPTEVHAVLNPYVQQFNQVVNEADSEFLENATAKFEEKVQIFRGQFEIPKARLANVPQNPTVTRPINPAATKPTIPPQPATGGGAFAGGQPNPNGGFPATAQPESPPASRGFQPPANPLSQPPEQPNDNSFGG